MESPDVGAGNLWSPETDLLIPFNYHPSDFQNKRLNKERLLQAFELSGDKTVPVFGVTDPGDGLGLLLDVGDRLLSALDLRLVVLGAPDSERRDLLHDLRSRHPDKMGVHAASSDPMAHLLLAGSDILLMLGEDGPPAGDLSRAFRYGCVPLVYDAGEVRSRVNDFEPITGRGNGFVFRPYEPDRLYAAVERAVQIFGKQRTFKKLVSKIMQYQ